MTSLPSLLTLGVALAIVAAWAATLRPTSLGGPTTYVRVSGKSMLPRLASGDLVIAREQSSYKAGDIVVFRVPAGQPGAGSLVVHRIVEAHADGTFVARGDNNTWNDPWTLRLADIEGEQWFAVPGAGRWLSYLSSPLMAAGAAASATVFLILLGPEGRSRRANPASQRPRPSLAGRLINSLRWRHGQTSTG